MLEPGLETLVKCGMTESELEGRLNPPEKENALRCVGVGDAPHFAEEERMGHWRLFLGAS